MNIVTLFIKTAIKLCFVLLHFVAVTMLFVVLYSFVAIRWLFFAPINLVLWAFDSDPIKVDQIPKFSELCGIYWGLAEVVVSDFLPKKYKSYDEMQRDLPKEKA